MYNYNTYGFEKDIWGFFELIVINMIIQNMTSLKTLKLEFAPLRVERKSVVQTHVCIFQTLLGHR